MSHPGLETTREAALFLNQKRIVTIPLEPPSRIGFHSGSLLVRSSRDKPGGRTTPRVLTPAWKLAPRGRLSDAIVAARRGPKRR
jgi:hypothetical protein